MLSIFYRISPNFPRISPPGAAERQSGNSGTALERQTILAGAAERQSWSGIRAPYGRDPLSEGMVETPPLECMVGTLSLSLSGGAGLISVGVWGSLWKFLLQPP